MKTITFIVVVAAAVLDFETVSLYTALAVLELILYTRQPSDSERSACISVPCVLGLRLQSFTLNKPDPVPKDPDMMTH